MAVSNKTHALGKIIRQGNYWAIVTSNTDTGLTEIELQLKREYEAANDRWRARFGPDMDAILNPDRLV